jgi:hypothetical protein
MTAEIRITITGNNKQEIREKAKRIVNDEELVNTDSSCRIASTR